MSCGCGNSTPQPCCSDCPDTNPCESGCLDTIDTSCIEYTTDTTGCLGIASGTKLDDIIKTLEAQICALSASGDKYVRISSIDPVSGYLFDKVTTSTYLTTTIVTSGGQQKLKLGINETAFVSGGEGNPIFLDTDGLNINYTTLVNTIINDPTLMSALCTAIASC